MIGFQTRSGWESGLDTVNSVHIFARSMFNRDQWLDKVHQLAYPTVVGLDAHFKPSRHDVDCGVAMIAIPPQPPETRYFLVAKQFTSEDGAPGWMIGLSIRSADRNRRLGISEIHSLVSRSLHLGSDLNEATQCKREGGRRREGCRAGWVCLG